jgi:hypothetical protein
VAAAEIPRDEAEIVVAPSATGFRRLAFLATAAFVLGGVGFVLLGRKGVTPASAIDPSHSFPTAVLPGPPTLPQETTEPAGLDVVATKRQAAPDVSDQHRKCLQVDADGKGKPKAVAKACRPAVEADPNDLDAIVILARAELDRGHLGEAKSLAKKALALDPNRFEAYIYLGNAEQEAGRIEEARAAYKKYLEFAPSGPFARELRAILSNL